MVFLLVAVCQHLADINHKLDRMLDHGQDKTHQAE